MMLCVVVYGFIKRVQCTRVPYVFVSLVGHSDETAEDRCFRRRKVLHEIRVVIDDGKPILILILFVKGRRLRCFFWPWNQVGSCR